MAQITRRLFTFVGVLAAAGPAAPQADPPPQPTAILDNGETRDILERPAYIELQEAMATPPAD